MALTMRASRKFWLRVKDVFLNRLSLQTVEGNEAFYFRNVDSKLYGAVLTHVNDVEVAGSPEFVEEVISVVEEQLTVSKVEEDIFRYAGPDIKVVTDRIKISMEDYSNSLKDITKIRKMNGTELLMKLKMKLY